MVKEVELHEPEYKEELGGFSVRFHKDIYTEENLRKMELSERQIKTVIYVKENGRITNREYQELVSTTKKTATSHDDLVRAFFALDGILPRIYLIVPGGGFRFVEGMHGKIPRQNETTKPFLILLRPLTGGKKWR